MNDPSNIHQDPTERGDKSTPCWILWGSACLLATLVVLSPIGILFCVMQKGFHDARSAREEFKRKVNPDELRAWALMQINKHPGGGYMTVSREEWSKTFPRFTNSRGLSLHLDPSKMNQGKRDAPLRGVLVWDFSAGYGMKATILLNADGTPSDLVHERDWTRGITIDMLSR